MVRRLGIRCQSRIQMECDQRTSPLSVTKVEELSAFISGFIERILQEKEAAKTATKAISHNSYRSMDRNQCKQFWDLILSLFCRLTFLLECFDFEVCSPFAVRICTGVSTLKQLHMTTLDSCLIGIASELMGTILVELRTKIHVAIINLTKFYQE